MVKIKLKPTNGKKLSSIEVDTNSDGSLTEEIWNHINTVLRNAAK